MKEIKIIGAGLSGLIMAEVLAANGFEYEIYEAKSKDKLETDNSVYYFHSNNILKIRVNLERNIISN